MLLDQNLAVQLLQTLASVYPGSTHVRLVGLDTADDDSVWAYALKEGLTIVSKDADFYQRSSLLGHPPKVIWLRVGNCKTARIASLLQGKYADIQAFIDDPDASFLVLS